MSDLSDDALWRQPHLRRDIIVRLVIRNQLAAHTFSGAGQAGHFLGHLATHLYSLTYAVSIPLYGGTNANTSQPANKIDQRM